MTETEVTHLNVIEAKTITFRRGTYIDDWWFVHDKGRNSLVIGSIFRDKEKSENN